MEQNSNYAGIPDSYATSEKSKIVLITYRWENLWLR